MKEFIRVDPDTPVYRIFPLPYFKETLRNRKLVLTSPECWLDRFEVLPHRTSVRIEGHPDCSFALEQYLAPAYAQCWSASRESDVLMRAYSRVVNSRTDKECKSKRNSCPREEGVRVRSTPRRLLQALKAGSPVESHCFVGAVEYVEPDFVRSRLSQIVTRIVGEAFAQGDGDLGQAITRSATRAFEQPETSARLLLVKRKAFEQEAEVRLLLVRVGHESGERLIQIPFDPNEVFEDVSFDSRLSGLEREERKENARSLGYGGGFSDSDLYDFIHQVIRVTYTAPSADF